MATGAPRNGRLRHHLGLVVPRSVAPVLRVCNETRNWVEGKVLIFDDSFEHEVWHESPEERIVLIVDVEYPEVDPTKNITTSKLPLVNITTFNKL